MDAIRTVSTKTTLVFSLFLIECSVLLRPRKKGEKLAYGLVHPVGSFDPIYVQVFNYKYIFGRFLSAKSWSERFSVLFKGPGWEPGSPRLGFHEKLPQIENPIQKYHVNISPALNLYVIFHFLFTLFFFSEFSKQAENYPTIFLSATICLIIYNLTCFGRIFDAKPNTFAMEVIRCVVIIIIDFYYGSLFRQLCFDSDTLYKIFKWLHILSINFMAILAVNEFLNKNSSSSSSSSSGSKPTESKSKSN